MWKLWYWKTVFPFIWYLAFQGSFLSEKDELLFLPAEIHRGEMQKSYNLGWIQRFSFRVEKPFFEACVS